MLQKKNPNTGSSCNAMIPLTLIYRWSSPYLKFENESDGQIQKTAQSEIDM